MGSPSPASPVTQTTQISQMDPRLYQWLYGTANSPGRQQIANASMLAKTMQGVQNADPTALAAFYNVPKGTDLTQFQSHTGAINPGQADPSLMQFPGKSVTPQDYYKQATAGEKGEKKSPMSTAMAAEGGELDAYAQGGRPKPKPKAEKLAQPTADLNEYGLTASQQRQFDKYEAMRNSGKKFTQQQIKDYNSMKDARTQYAQDNPNAAKSKTDLSLRDAQVGVTPFYDPETKQSTNPYYNRAVDVLRGMETLPGQYGQAGDAYSKLQNMANYAPQQVTGKDVEAARYNASLADASGYSASLSDASGYSAAMMNAPKDIQAQAYDAAQMNAAQMKAAQASRGDIRDIAAQMADVERYNAAQIERTQREQAATTQGPKSWTDPGVARQYMNPYQQAVTSQDLFEANRQAQMRENQQRSQATQQRAFGGTRAALQESEGRRNLGYLLSDIQNKGSQQAYQSGMGQFSAEQGLGAQVGMSNTQQINQLKQQYMQMGLSEAQANQAAINQASQINAATQNTAYNNYVAQQLAAQQANQGMDWNTVNLNTSNQQAAALANAQFQQQAAAANQNAINQQRSQYVTQQLEAAKVNYGGQLTAAQQNQIAQNAASQFNAGNQQQINLANQNALNAASQFNAGNQQQINLANQNALNTAGQYNAGNQQQANMANQLYGVGGFNAQTQNQQAGLTANQQNIGAMGQAGQGLLNVGQGVGAYNQNLLQNWGAAGNTMQNLAQGYYDKRQQSAQNIWGGVNTATQPATGTLLGSPWGTSYQGQYQQRKKGGKLSIKV